jgi:hypothetical protein
VTLATIKRLERLSERISEAFPGHYAAEKKTLDDDIRLIKELYDVKLGTTRLDNGE